MNAVEIELSSPGTLETALGAAKLIQGPPGEAATVEVGLVTSGDTASVQNAGTGVHAVFDFVLPRGEAGKSAYQTACDAGFSGTEAEFNDALLNLGDIGAVLDEINGEVI